MSASTQKTSNVNDLPLEIQKAMKDFENGFGQGKDIFALQDELAKASKASGWILTPPTFTQDLYWTKA